MGIKTHLQNLNTKLDTSDKIIGALGGGSLIGTGIVSLIPQKEEDVIKNKQKYVTDESEKLSKQKIEIDKEQKALQASIDSKELVSQIDKEKRAHEINLKTLEYNKKQKALDLEKQIIKLKVDHTSNQESNSKKLEKIKENAKPKVEPKTVDPVKSTTKPKDPTVPEHKFNPYVLGGVAAAGLGYLALKRMRAKRAERRFAEQDFNRQYS